MTTTDPTVRLAAVVGLIDAKIEGYRRALPPGKSVTVDFDTTAGAWEQLRARVVALAHPEPTAVVVVTWAEPEEGVEVYGPFDTEEDARAAIPTIEPDFHNDGVLPDDVVFEVKRMGAPR